MSRLKSHLSEEWLVELPLVGVQALLGRPHLPAASHITVELLVSLQMPLEVPHLPCAVVAPILLTLLNYLHLLLLNICEVPDVTGLGVHRPQRDASHI